MGQADGADALHVGIVETAGKQALPMGGLGGFQARGLGAHQLGQGRHGAGMGVEAVEDLRQGGLDRVPDLRQKGADFRRDHHERFALRPLMI